MPFLIVLVTCIFIGILAQKAKKRTGALWGFIAFGVISPIWFFLINLAVTSAPELFQGVDANYTPYSIAITASLIGGGILLLAVLTLPVKKEDMDATMKCPYCAELIKKEAIKCRYCGQMLSDKQSEQGLTDPAIQGTPEDRVIWSTKTAERLIDKKTTNRKNPVIALVLSLLMPGLGQFYNEQVGRGFFFLIGFWVSVCIFLAGIFVPPASFYHYFPFEYSPLYAIVLGILIGFSLWMLSFGDAYDGAKRSSLFEGPVSKKRTDGYGNAIYYIWGILFVIVIYLVLTGQWTSLVTRSQLNATESYPAQQDVSQQGTSTYIRPKIYHLNDGSYGWLSCKKCHRSTYIPLDGIYNGTATCPICDLRGEVELEASR